MEFNLNDAEYAIDNNLRLMRKNLYYLRKKIHKKTFDEMASDTGVSRDSLFRIESVPDRSPYLITILKICYYHNVSIDDLLNKDIEYEDAKKLATIEYSSENSNLGGR
jgi:DNA-binding XRE family transcriptional regulator